jgi:hypothetical protein
MIKKCDCLKQIQERWPEPFERPIMVNQELGLEVSDWAVKVYALNPSGTIKKGSVQHLMLTFCPICGNRLRRLTEEEPNDDQS